ncbi:uncharacterized protein LOC128553469 [Mercenaria mercenaria]|uniref:uncharacterized protein LOC128553469 n=1 Tax=Mercenaria mercenaria TaxID=6596 RepID=UPI00234ECFA2|nr:uncharacterized protein LOC128553469 [Mercenaria mercenaria]
MNIKKQHDSEIADLKKKVNALKMQEGTIKTLVAKFSSLSITIKQEWTEWFQKYKEETPKDLESIYEKLLEDWEKEWINGNSEEIRRQIEDEYDERISSLERENRKLKEALKRIQSRPSVKKETERYTEILRELFVQDSFIRTEMTEQCQEAEYFEYAQKKVSEEAIPNYS